MNHITSSEITLFQLDSHSVWSIKNDCHLKHCNATVQAQVIKSAKAMEALDSVDLKYKKEQFTLVKHAFTSSAMKTKLTILQTISLLRPL